MTDNPAPNHADDEIDLLDILVTLAENIRLLILGPLFSGLLAFGVVSAWPVNQQHLSSFTLQGQKIVGGVELFTPVQVNQLVTSPAVLADATKALQNSGQGHLAVLLRSGAVTVNIPNSTTHVQVTVKAPDPQAADTVAQALLAASLFNSHLKGEVKANIEAELQKDQQSLDQARLMEARLSQNLNGKDGLPDLKLLETYQSWVGTVGNILVRIKSNQIRLVGLDKDDVITPPAVSSIATGPNVKPVVAISVTATLSFLLIFVFVRQAFRIASANPQSAAKIARIRLALGLKV